MLGGNTSPWKGPSASLSGKVHGHDHSTYQYFQKIHVFIKSFVSHSICTVFTILFLGSLPSLSIFIFKCIYIYMYVFMNIYIYIIHKYGIYLAISKVSTFPCPLKVNNGFQWLIFSKITKGLYQEISENNISAQDISQNISTKHYLEKNPTNSEEALAPKKSLKRNLYQCKIQ